MIKIVIGIEKIGSSPSNDQSQKEEKEAPEQSEVIVGEVEIVLVATDKTPA